MKTLVIILSAVGLLSLNSCKQETDPQALMENSETRTEVFNTITENQDYMSEFMGQMQNSEQTMQMMQGNKKMMTMMMSEKEKMMEMMKENPEMMQGMMNNMMNMADADSSMCAHMMTMMKDKPNMMGQMMEMMNKEGMMDKETMIKDKEKMGKENHSDHH
jgi:hypothetical protein